MNRPIVDRIIKGLLYPKLFLGKILLPRNIIGQNYKFHNQRYATNQPQKQSIGGESLINGSVAIRFKPSATI